jgi:ElaB/YqjD/DUF883 family membrane-anchored ribosome-binding protein
MAARKKTTMDRQSEISEEFDKFLEDLESLLQDAASLSGDELSLIKDQLKDRVAKARETARRVGDDMTDHAHQFANTANQQVHEEPWKAVGAGAALGLLLGLLVARR